jgi:hypothetical protein
VQSTHHYQAAAQSLERNDCHSLKDFFAQVEERGMRLHQILNLEMSRSRPAHVVLIGFIKE